MQRSASSVVAKDEFKGRYFGSEDTASTHIFRFASRVHRRHALINSAAGTTLRHDVDDLWCGGIEVRDIICSKLRSGLQIPKPR
jgi:hypothetical protein